MIFEIEYKGRVVAVMRQIKHTNIWILPEYKNYNDLYRDTYESFVEKNNSNIDLSLPKEVEGMFGTLVFPLR